MGGDLVSDPDVDAAAIFCGQSEPECLRGSTG